MDTSKIKIMISFISTGLTIGLNSYGYYKAKENNTPDCDGNIPEKVCKGIFLPFTISLFSFHILISFFLISCLCRKNINNNLKLQGIENMIISLTCIIIISVLFKKANCWGGPDDKVIMLIASISSFISNISSLF